MEEECQVKVVILGNPDVGKSSILHRYLTGSYQVSTENTIGAKFMGKRVLHKGTFLKLNIWDTAGQERYQSFSKIYCRDAGVLILVYDHTEPGSFEGMKKWYEIMSQDTLPAEVITFIAGNKADVLENQAQIEQQVINYSININAECFNVSAKTGLGIEEMFAKITEKVLMKNKNNNKNSVILDYDKHAQEKKKKKHKKLC